MKRRAAAIIAAGIFAVLLAFCVGWSLSQRSGATTVRLSELQARSHAAPQTTQSQIDLPEKANVNLYTAEPRDIGDMETLPLSLGAATKRAEESEFIRAHLPQSLIGCYRHH